MKPRPTEAEFDELKRKRDAALEEAMQRVCAANGWDPKEVLVHRSHAFGCYCACPDGPCQHIWDGPEWTSEDRTAGSATCSRCGEIAMYHDMRCGP